MINKNQQCEMIILLKSLKNINKLIVPIILMVVILMILIKWPIWIFGFCLSYVGSGYFSFYTNYIPIMTFSTLSFFILILSQIINDLTPVGKL